MSAREEIRPGESKSIDNIFRQAGTRRRPTCAVVGRKKNTARSPSKEVHARDSETPDSNARQAGTRRSPACPVVGGKKNSVGSPGKQIGPGNGKRIDVAPVRSIGLNPL